MKFLVFLLVSVAAAVLVGVTLSGRAPGGPADDYHAIFANASNLVAGDEVRVAGIRVGTVDGLSIMDESQVLVTFSAQRTVGLTAGTHAAVKYKNLVGDRYLELTAGDGRKLVADGTIPVSQTAPALDLDALFNGFKPLLAALSPDQVNRVSTELVTVLQGEGGTIDDLLAALASVTSTLADRDQVIGDLISNLNSALGKVNTGELGQLITQLQRLGERPGRGPGQSATPSRTSTPSPGRRRRCSTSSGRRCTTTSAGSAGSRTP